MLQFFKSVFRKSRALMRNNRATDIISSTNLTVMQKKILLEAHMLDRSGEDAETRYCIRERAKLKARII